MRAKALQQAGAEHEFAEDVGCIAIEQREEDRAGPVALAAENHLEHDCIHRPPGGGGAGTGRRGTPGKPASENMPRPPMPAGMLTKAQRRGGALRDRFST